MALLSTTTGLANLSSNIASALGLEGWQLKTGKYNGCTFVAFVDIPILENSMLYQAGADLVASYNQNFGTPSAQDPNRAGQLYSTDLALLQFTDTLIQGKVIKETPYTDSVNIEDVGFKGYEFKMSLLFIGDDYLTALYNFEKAIITKPANPSQYLSLEHPTRGKIAGYTYVTEGPQIITSLAYWQGCIVNVTFRSVDTQGVIAKAPVISTARQVARALNAALASVNAIGTTVAQIKGAQTNLQRGFFSPRLLGAVNQSSSGDYLSYTQYINIVNATTELQKTLYNCVLYVYRYGNSSVKVSQLSASTIDYNYIPKVLNQTKKYTLPQGDIILNFYYQQTNQVLALIASYGVQTVASDLIVQIKKSITNLSAVCQTIGNKITTNYYVTPYNMSIRRVLSLNNLELNRIGAVLELNPQIISANYVPENTVVNLP